MYPEFLQELKPQDGSTTVVWMSSRKNIDIVDTKRCHVFRNSKILPPPSHISFLSNGDTYIWVTTNMEGGSME